MGVYLDKTGVAHLWNKILAKLSGRVPTSRTVNGKALSSNILLTASDVGAIPNSAKGTAGGVASLDTNGKVPASQLPSYVDDVLEYNSRSNFPTAGESGKIYVDAATNKSYRWSGSTYTEISSSLVIGSTSESAGRGDLTEEAYKHSQSAHAPVNAAANVQSDWNELNTLSDAFIKNKPSSLPANGGNASTVNGYTVYSNVPSGARFTDTTYTPISTAEIDEIFASLNNDT